MGPKEEQCKVTEYYVQDKTRSVDNSMVWWRAGDRGYSCDLKQARVWKREELEDQCKGAGDLRAWPQAYIDERIQHHIDMYTIDFDPENKIFIDF